MNKNVSPGQKDQPEQTTLQGGECVRCDRGGQKGTFCPSWTGFTGIILWT